VNYRQRETVPISIRVGGIISATARVMYIWPDGGQERQIDGGTINGDTTYSVSPPLSIPDDAPLGGRRVTLELLQGGSYREIARCSFAVIAGGGPTPTPTRTPDTPPTTPAPPTCAPLEGLPGLVAWWRLDERSGEVAVDSIANPVANNGIMCCLPLEFGAGKVAGALRFNGRDTSIDVEDHPSLDFGTSRDGDFSMAAWVKFPPGALTNGVHVAISKQASAGGPGYQLHFLNAQPSMQIADESGYTNFGAGVPVPKDDQWHHVAVAVDRDVPSGGRFYLDGAPLGQPFDPTARPGTLENASFVRIGAQSFTGMSRLDGWLDEVDIYRSALSAAAVARLHQAGSAGKCAPGPGPGPTTPPLRRVSGR
jgi:hypothetical protein